MRVETAPGTPPTSRTPLHAAPRARVVGSAAGEKSCCGKSAPPARAPFWAWPNNVSRLCVAQARGSCRCTKVGAHLCTPLLVHGQSKPRATKDGNGSVLDRVEQYQIHIHIHEDSLCPPM